MGSQTLNTLTAAQVSAASHPHQPAKLFDGGGLYLHIKSSGKYWRLKYRFAGKERLLALGVYPEISLQMARSERGAARGLMAKGIDPGAERQAKKASRFTAAANSFEVVAREWWHDVHQHQVVRSHSMRNIRRLEMYLFPRVGSRPIASLAPADVLEALRRIEVKGFNETAHRVKSLCGQIFRYAVTTGRAERDVTGDLREALRPAETVHHPALLDEREIGALLRSIDGYLGTPSTCAALRLAPLVFVRPGELRQARWHAVRLDDAEWHFEPSKRGPPLVVPLARQAVTILAEQQQISAGSEYVFPSSRSLSRPMSNNAVNAALHRMDYKGLMSGHGFRAMARTVLAERLNYREDIIEQQLAHAVRDPNGRAYNRTTFLPQRREMLQTWADYLDQLRDGGVEHMSKVV